MGDSSSNVASVVGDNGDADAIGKAEGPSHDGTPSSMDTDAEQEAGAENAQEPAQPQKRKGGRKPVSVCIRFYRRVLKLNYPDICYFRRT